VTLTPPPSTYSSWLDLFERFQAGDDEVLPALEAGTLTWSSGVAQRWTERVSEALTARLGVLATQLQRAIGRAAGDLHAVARALGEARRGLAPLARFCALAAMPAEVRAHLRRELERWTEQTQASLERQAERLRGDQGLLLATLRSSRLELSGASPGAATAATAPPPAGPGAAAGEPPPGGPRSRRILLEE
jgi:hypothetical protein